MINLGIGQPDFRTPDHIVQAGKDALDDGAHGYTPAAGLPELRESVARQWTARLTDPVAADEVLIVAGGKNHDVLRHSHVRRAGCRDPLSQPRLPHLRVGYRLQRRHPRPYRAAGGKRLRFRPRSGHSLRSTPQTRLIILNRPGNPTGGVVSRDVIDRLVAGLEQHQHLAILSDEIYDQILYDGREHVSLLDYPQIRDRLIVLNGWSKTYAMTGWRLGYSSGPEPCCRTRNAWAINSYSCPNAATQHAGLAALEGPQDAVRRWSLSSIPGARSSSRTQRRAWLPLRATRRGVLRLPQHRRHRLQLRDAAGQAPGRSWRSHCRGEPASAPTGKVTCGSHTPTAPRTSALRLRASATC